jgi:hypothetical protein
MGCGGGRGKLAVKQGPGVPASKGWRGHMQGISWSQRSPIKSLVNGEWVIALARTIYIYIYVWPAGCGAYESALRCHQLAVSHVFLPSPFLVRPHVLHLHSCCAAPPPQSRSPSPLPIKILYKNASIFFLLLFYF